MAKSFKSLSTETALDDQLTFGKFKGCRVCDIIESEFEYILWLDSNKMVKFSQAVLDKVSSLISERDADIFYQNEVQPYLDDDFDDLPF
jgi:uncharacterized protein (DUF3820 family)